jgi:hypothetical protein
MHIDLALREILPSDDSRPVPPKRQAVEDRAIAARLSAWAGSLA